MKKESKDFWSQFFPNMIAGLIAPLLVSIFSDNGWIILLYSLFSILFLFILTKIYQFVSQIINTWFTSKLYKREMVEYWIKIKGISDHLIQYFEEREIFVTTIDFIAHFIEQRYSLSKPNDPLHHEKVRFGDSNHYRETTTDVFKELRLYFHNIERDRLFVLKSKLICPKCQKMLSIKQPRDEILVECENCKANISYKAGNFNLSGERYFLSCYPNFYDRSY